LAAPVDLNPTITMGGLPSGYLKIAIEKGISEYLNIYMYTLWLFNIAMGNDPSK